ncbi:P-loop NTPase fold protein [Plantactinospora sp. ZYX-F-223]|uniref:P-loop NTPase fold protein n=1 Tax=Plantactinospora sp. ZYX-F-223 TaxID=3144103 RepID=UPI0031FC9A0F
MVAVDEGEFVLLNDLPVEDQTLDLLGTSMVAGELANLIYGSRASTPFVLAVDGRWGTGKSTLMRQLSDILAGRPAVQTVWFNAWTASGVSALTGLLKVVLGKLDRNVVRRAFRRLRDNELLGSSVRIGATVAASFFRLDRALDQLWAQMSVDARAREQARELLRNSLDAWVDETTGEPRHTIVVFVDDLDRCGEATAIEICEAIKLYLDLPGIAFVLGCDLSVLSRIPLSGIETGAQVREYLEKIVQVSYQIPVASEATVASMIRGYAARSRTGHLLTEPLIALIGRQCAGNPRRVKRLLNSFVAEYQLDPHWRQFGADGLLKSVLLQHLYPDLYRDILHTAGDTAGDFLAYRHARNWLLGRGQLSSDDESIRAGQDLMTSYGVVPPGGGADLELWERALGQLDGRVSEAWRLLVDNEDCHRLIRDLGPEDERLRLQNRLRRRPLSTAPTPLDPSAGTEPRFDGLRLLWVDDKPAGNEMTIESLTARGAQVRTCVDTRQALDLLLMFRPNALVSDVGRDGDDQAGFDGLRALREAGYSGPALFFSSYVSDERRRQADAVGAEITSSAARVSEWAQAQAAAVPSTGRQRSPDAPEALARRK